MIFNIYDVKLSDFKLLNSDNFTINDIRFNLLALLTFNLPKDESIDNFKTFLEKNITIKDLYDGLIYKLDILYIYEKFRKDLSISKSTEKLYKFICSLPNNPNQTYSSNTPPWMSSYKPPIYIDY